MPPSLLRPASYWWRMLTNTPRSEAPDSVHCCSGRAHNALTRPPQREPWHTRGCQACTQWNMRCAPRSGHMHGMCCPTLTFPTAEHGSADWWAPVACWHTKACFCQRSMHDEATNTQQHTGASQGQKSAPIHPTLSCTRAPTCKPTLHRRPRTSAGPCDDATYGIGSCDGSAARMPCCQEDCCLAVDATVTMAPVAQKSRCG